MFLDPSSNFIIVSGTPAWLLHSIGGRKTTESAVSKCIICFRAKANLPADHVTASHSFKVTGLDFCGPFYYKNAVWNKSPIKCYICIFICFSTKAVHLELVQDLSTSAFLNAWVDLYWPAESLPAYGRTTPPILSALGMIWRILSVCSWTPHQTAGLEFCLTDSIEWRFIPPRSPHFGGLWEEAVNEIQW